MKLDIRPTLQQKQTLKMTQNMQMSIALLNKQTLELRNFLIEEQEKNPYLDIKDWGESTPDSTPSALGDAVSSAESRHTEQDETKPISVNEHSSVSDTLADFDWNSYRTNSGGSLGETRVRKKNDYDTAFSFEDVTAADESLSQKLEGQILSLDQSEEMKNIMLFMAYDIDERGFLSDSNEEIAEQLDVPVSAVETARSHLQHLDPYGIASTGIREYLRFMFFELRSRFKQLQCEQSVKTLLTDDELLRFLVEKKFDPVIERLKLTPKEFRELLVAIKEVIPPYPAWGYETGVTETVIPSLSVHLIEGKVIIQLDNRFIPSVVLNKKAFEEDIQKIKNDDERRFLKEQYQAAEWLIKSLSERNKTLYQVASTLFSYQKAFLEFGPDFLKPLTLKEIATTIGRHPSTVSRLTRGKYAETPHGIYELKSLFVKQVSSSALTTNKKLETVIREIIEIEEKSHPLSDDDIASELNRRGIDVARRTIAKYRAKLKIPSARERKRNYTFSGG